MLVLVQVDCEIVLSAAGGSTDSSSIIVLKGGEEQVSSYLRLPVLK